MKWLIVNGDDFSANGGIIEAHRRGILTSTSLIVNAPWSEEAAALSRAVPALSVGLHVHIVSEGREGATGPIDEDSYRAELCRQFFRFQELVGRPPTHLDSHHNIQRDPRLLPHFLKLARQYGLPLRDHSPVRYFSKFYSGYSAERATELRTLCDPIVRQALAVQQIQLVSFRDLGALLAELPT
jgi:chitin disaccharide deacetylase